MAIKAFHSSDISDLGYRLKMIGLCNEKYKHELYALMHSLGIENFVDWVEYTDDVKPYFENATAFLMCSDFEGMGRVTAEAMFYGCPIIARATGGTMDLIKHGETGWLFETVEECADLIKKVITDDNEAMVQRAHDFAKHELAEEVYGKKIMDVYNSIL